MNQAPDLFAPEHDATSMRVTRELIVMRAAGTTELVTDCDCCGRSDLRRTVIMKELDADGNQVGQRYFGVVCAAKASGRAVADIKAEAKQADDDFAATWKEAASLNRQFNEWKTGQDREAVIADRRQWVPTSRKGTLCWLIWRHNTWGRFMGSSYDFPQDERGRRHDWAIEQFEV